MLTFVQKALLAAALVALLAAPAAYAATAFAPTRIAGQPGQVTPIAHWQIQSSAKAQEGGAEGLKLGEGREREAVCEVGEDTGCLREASYPVEMRERFFCFVELT